MASMAETELSILDDLRALADPFLQYAYLVECGKTLPAMPDTLKSDENLVRECEVRTWFALVDGGAGDGPAMAADSESLIVRGALALVAEVLEAGSPAEWAAHEWRLLDDADFARSFTAKQLAGLRAMLARLGGDQALS